MPVDCEHLVESSLARRGHLLSGDYLLIETVEVAEDVYPVALGNLIVNTCFV